MEIDEHSGEDLNFNSKTGRIDRHERPVTVTVAFTSLFQFISVINLFLRIRSHL